MHALLIVIYSKSKSTIDWYVQASCNEGTDFCHPNIIDKYGWPILSWCVVDVTDMASLFEGLDTFDKDNWLECW